MRIRDVYVPAGAPVHSNDGCTEANETNEENIVTEYLVKLKLFTLKLHTPMRLWLDESGSVWRLLLRHIIALK